MECKNPEFTSLSCTPVHFACTTVTVTYISLSLLINYTLEAKSILWLNLSLCLAGGTTQTTECGSSASNVGAFANCIASISMFHS